MKFVKALYNDAMDPEVLSWDDAGNNRFLASGRGSLDPQSDLGLPDDQKSNPELADKICLEDAGRAGASASPPGRRTPT